MLGAVAGEARARGHTFSVVFSPTARGREWLAELDAQEIAVRFADGRDRRALARAIADDLGPSQAALIDTHFTAFDLPALRVAMTRRAQTAVVWHLHTTLGRGWRVRLANSVKLGLAGRRVDRIVAVSPHLAAGARRRLAPAARTVALANAVDLQRFPYRTAESVARARGRLGIDGDRPVLLHFGRHWHLKGGDLLLGALAILAAGGAQPPLLLSVAGPDAVRHAEAVGLGGSVRALEPTHDVAALYTAADVFVSSSRAEGMPFSILEAAATGAAVLATDIPGQADLARALPGARLAALTPEALAGGLEELLGRDRVHRDADAAAARAWIEQHADITAGARALVDLYDEVLRGR
jgi:glycosyltransferase involved in cell wall biosynthesis